MVLDIKMCRFENVSWGFRLVGGSDYEFPLTVVKVNEGSIAEEAGLCVGDVIVRINDTAASPLSHDEAHKIIMHCGNVFYFGVYRESFEDEPQPKQFPIIGLVERPSTPESFLDVVRYSKSPNSLLESNELDDQNEYISELSDRPSSVMSEGTEIKLVEEEIAAVLSGESEVLKEHNVMGIFPKPGVCMTSDVLRTLNEEVIKTKAEKDKENKKWTTFLQKPDRPIPKSKAQIEAERRAANAYKVKIVKSAPKSREPTVERTPEPEPVVVPEPVIETPKEPTPPIEEVEEEPPTDTEVPNLEVATAIAVDVTESVSVQEAIEVDELNANSEEKSDKEKETSPSTDDLEISEETVISIDAEMVEATPALPEKTEEELALERQLADVQKQLQALSSLPSTIQATLDSVTKQLADLLPTFRLQQVSVEPINVEPREINLECIEENTEEKETTKDNEIKGDDDNQEVKISTDVVAESKDNFYNIDSDEEPCDPAKKQKTVEHQEETRQMEEEQSVKKQKRHDVIEELEEHLERKNNPNKQRSKRAFGPLTPSSERPLVLPGGRRWYRPKDAYNDEFIAETLSAQAELITGTTLGCPYESPLLGYDLNEYHGASVALQWQLDRVNFMKYQKPERKIDYNRSEVYKVVHHLDRQPVRGIEIRAPVVPAEVDIRTAIHS